jgi:hypothetical protein
MGNPLFLCNSLILCCSQEDDPFSPPEGEVTQGEHPLTPILSGFFINLLMIIAIWGMPERRGRKDDVLEPPRAIDCFLEDFNKASS